MLLFYIPLDWEVLGSSPGHTKDLSKANALAIKRRSSDQPQRTSIKRRYNSKSWLSDKIKEYKTYEPYKCTAFDIS